jgi:hypothetical protein
MLSRQRHCLQKTLHAAHSIATPSKGTVPSFAGWLVAREKNNLAPIFYSYDWKHFIE